MLAQARQWLERAKESTTPAQDVAEFKAFVATVAEAAKQKKLSEAIQLDAVEMVRRSERALGVAIREGQANGEIESVPEARIRATLTRDVGMGRADQIGLTDLIKPKPTDFAPAHELSGVHGAGIYKMTDNVTDEQFDAALSEAKDEGNLSRANVVRKVAEISTYREQQSDKWARVVELAEQGYTSRQIAGEVGMSEEGLRAGAIGQGSIMSCVTTLGISVLIHSDDRHRILRSQDTTAIPCRNDYRTRALDFRHFNRGKHVAITSSDDNPVTVATERTTHDR